MIDEAALWNLAEQTPGISALALLVYWFLKHLREDRELRDSQTQRDEARRERIETRRVEAMNRVCEECRHANRESVAVIRESTRVISLCTAALESFERTADVRPRDAA